jgi:SOS response regulatory protein OraA/RecX
LRRKGVAPLLVNEIVRATFGQLDEATQASRVLTKHFKGERLNEPLVARRAAAFLQRRGYSDSVIFALLGGSLEADQT